MSNLNARLRMEGDLQAAIAEMLHGTMEERGRGFASDREAWAELKERLENAEERVKDIKKLHKELWDAVKDHNGDAFCAFAQEFERSSARLAADLVAMSVMAKIAVELTEE